MLNLYCKNIYGPTPDLVVYCFYSPNSLCNCAHKYNVQLYPSLIHEKLNPKHIGGKETGSAMRHKM